ncbi:MAG TPA: hypothetical protein VFP00_08835 [Burkholderiales bacterium]|nr:hypothetical protein [Burkholderiales bacterium]
MNQATTRRTRTEWLRRSDPLPAQERLRTVVAALTRARRVQLLVDHGLGGLLAGLTAATVAVLAVRLVPLPYSLWQIACAAVGAGLAAALAVGWRRRPDALEVAIRADLMLRLKQRLSTAWEIMTVRDDAELTERLAAEAVKAGLPARPWLVFPLRVNRWGWLLPLPAAALLLVSVLDLSRTQPTVPREVDERVVSEGQRLSAFARAMQARAKRDALPRSAGQATGLERLGARMESGALSRGQALEQLRQMGRSLDQESMQALADAREASGIEPPLGERGSELPNAPGLASGGTPEGTMNGALQGGDTRTLARDRLDNLARSGVRRHELEEAIRRKRAADDEAAKDKREKPEVSAQALKDHEELRRAREQVRRARENLDDALAGVDAGGGSATDMESSEDDETPEDRAADKRRDQRKGGNARRYGPRGDLSTASEPRQSPPQSQSAQSGPVIKPRAEMREGEVFASQGRVLPRLTRPSVENVEMKQEFASQVEEVLSRDHYPAHYKEFIRRYFLSLSQGGQSPQPQPPGKRNGHGE